MDSVPENADEIESFLLTDVLHGIELDPEDSTTLLSYMGDQHEHLYGPYCTYFVLGSYDPPFRYRLDEALDELNHRHDAYAFLMATQADPDVADYVPVLKVKFYLHALLADYITFVLEHNRGGALTEFGRVDHRFLIDRTYVFPRAREQRYDDYDTFDDLDDYRARAVELVYQHRGAAFNSALEALVDHANDNGFPLTTEDLRQYLDRELDGRNPSYSGVLTDGFAHYDDLDQCFSWTSVDELRDELDNVP